MPAKQKITTFLWFDASAEEAAKHYVSIFKDSKILGVARYGEAGPGPKGSVMTVNFQLEGQEFIGLNGGPQFKFTEAIKMMQDKDPKKSKRVMEAMLQMKKMDIARLEQAYGGP